jgi:hypothetical protein
MRAEGSRHGGRYTTGLATYGPFSAIYFLTYERFKKFCLGHTNELGTHHYVAGTRLSALNLLLYEPLSYELDTHHYVAGTRLSALKLLVHEALSYLAEGRGREGEGGREGEAGAPAAP